jgi:hypothetical protein
MAGLGSGVALGQFPSGSLGEPHRREPVGRLRGRETVFVGSAVDRGQRLPDPDELTVELVSGPAEGCTRMC